MSRERIYNILVGLIIFLVPTNLFLKFSEKSAYVNGLQVDYLISKLYLSDIFILIMLAFWLVGWVSDEKNREKKPSGPFIDKIKKNLIIFLVGLLLANKYFIADSVSSSIYLIRILILGLFLSFLKRNRKIISKKIVEIVVLAALAFQAGLGIYQYIFQKSFWGYMFLGEPNLQNYIGVSKSSLFGVEKILPYGSAAHPNVLGGFLAIYLLYILKNTELMARTKNKITQPSTNQLFKILVVGAAIFALLLTQSFSAITTFIAGSILIFSQKNSPKIAPKFLQNKLSLKNAVVITALILIVTIFSINFLAQKFPQSTSITRRNYLNHAAIKMWQEKITTGVGLNNFTAEVEKFSPNREVVRFVQPVHNIFLLALSEIGLIGLFIITIAAHQNKKSLTKKNWWWFVTLLPIALLDHYLLTLNSGLLLLVFWWNFFLD